MDRRLEDYLIDLAAELSPLPEAKRAEELRETRQHLLNAVMINQEKGQSEDEALKNALAQFGTPKELGGKFVWAWQRGERIESRWSFWGATVCMMVLISPLGIFLASPAPINSLLDSFQAQDHPWVLVAMLLGIDTIYMLIGGLAGGIAGFVFPKRAVGGAKFVVAIGYGSLVCRDILWALFHGYKIFVLDSSHFLSLIHMMFLAAVPTAIIGVALILSAKGTSRKRQKKAIA